MPDVSLYDFESAPATTQPCDGEQKLEEAIQEEEADRIWKLLIESARGT